MVRIIIICEGQTEVEFCKNVLLGYFAEQEIYLEMPLIRKSGGGMVSWPALKKQVDTHLLQDPTSYVTTLIDYYGIQAKHQLPNWDLSLMETDKNNRITGLEKAMLADINLSLQHRFVPYIQLHEFEGLLFNNMDVFTSHLENEEIVDKDELARTLQQYPNPELINDTVNNAPSYRLKRLIKGYNKIVYGALLAEAIGLERLRAKSPRFNNWVSTLENLK